MASQYGYHDVRSFGLGISSSELGARALPSKHLLGTGLASVGYETELNGKKYARKDFMGVPSSTFRREAGRLIWLEDHINVVKTLDWTENNMSCSLVLEYMDDDLLGFMQNRKQSQGSMEAGPNSGNQSDLDSRNTIKLAPFELPEALDLMLQIARGMEYLADKGIRHGNLKTKNVLVTRTNDQDRKSLSVKVSDFGLVRTRRKSTSFASRQARKLDMARWTAPELLQVFLLEDKGETSSESDSDEDFTDSSDVIDSDVPEWRELGADVYSFAVTCSQILTGEDPFPYPNLNWKELGVNIVRHGLTPTLPAACPPELRGLLVSCWGFDRLCPRLFERPSFSHIRATLERLQHPLPVKAPMDNLQQMDLLAQRLHECLPQPENAPMDIRRKAWMVISRKAWMDISRKASIDIITKIQLRKFMPMKEPTDVVREIGLREPITVEDLWGPKCLLDAVWRSVGSPLKSAAFCSISLEMLVFSVASLIARTRTVVRCRTEWTQLREELELMLPDMLRIRNLWVGYEKALDGKGLNDRNIRTFVKGWVHQLESVVPYILREVEEHQQQADDRPVLSSLHATLTPITEPKFRDDISKLAKEQKKILLDLTLALRQAQRAKEQAKEHAEVETGVNKLESAVPCTLREVEEHQQQEDDRPVLSSLPATLTAITEPKFRNDISELAKKRKKIQQLDLTVALRQAQRAKEQAKEHAEVETGVNKITVVIRLSSALYISNVKRGLTGALLDLELEERGNEIRVSAYPLTNDFGGNNILDIVLLHDRHAVMTSCIRSFYVSTNADAFHCIRNREDSGEASHRVDPMEGRARTDAP